MKIQLNQKSKINNPIDFNNIEDEDYIYSFEGIFDPEFFIDDNLIEYQYLKHQLKNYLDIKNILSISEFQFEYIWLMVFKNEDGNRGINFVIKTNTLNNLTIFWRKYITKVPGSGQNDIYSVWNDKKEKDKMTKWIEKHKSNVNI